MFLLRFHRPARFHCFHRSHRSLLRRNLYIPLLFFDFSFTFVPKSDALLFNSSVSMRSRRLFRFSGVDTYPIVAPMMPPATARLIGPLLVVLLAFEPFFSFEPFSAFLFSLFSACVLSNFVSVAIVNPSIF